MDMLCILWYCIVLHVIALYCMVLHGIVLYLTVLHGIALLASARGLYLARHLSTLFIDSCESDGSGDSGEFGNSVESCDLLNLVIMKYLMNIKIW